MLRDPVDTRWTLGLRRRHILLFASSTIAVGLLSACGAASAPAATLSSSATASGAAAVATAVSSTSPATTARSASVAKTTAATASAVATSSAAPATSASVAAAATSTSPGAQGATVSWTSWATGPDQVRTQAQKDAFQKAYPAIKVDMQNVDYSGYFDKLTAGLAGGTAPDVYRVTPLNIADYALKGAAKLLDPLIARAGKGAFTTNMFPNVVDAGKLGGKLYGVPHGADTCCLHVNETLFKNAGIPLPPTDWTDPRWTWDRFIDVATRLTKFTTKASTGAAQQQAAQMALQYGVAQTWWGIAGPLGSVITMNGGSMFDPTMKKVTLGERPSVSAIQWAADLASKHHVIPATADEKKQFTFDLKSGNEAMFWFYGSTEVVTLETAIAGNFDHNMYPAPHPAGQPPHAYFHQSYWLINQATKHPDEAWQFANFLGLPAGRIPELAVGFGLPMTADPAEAATFLSKYPNLHKQVITQAVSLAVPWRFPLGYLKMDQTASEALTNDVMYLGKKSVSDALASVIPVLQNTLDTAKPS